MILWDKTFEDLGVVENNINKKSKIWFKCDNCGAEYVLSYKTIMERKRCKRDKCKFCTNKFLTDEQRELNGKGYARKCRAGYSDKKKKRLNRYYLNSWHNYAVRKVYTIEDKHGVCDITVDFIENMLESQNYECKLSGIKLCHDKLLNSMSIDRIDNDYGHTKDNVQIICRGLNIAKNIHTNDDILLFIECLVGNETFIPCKISRDYVSSIRRNSEMRDRKRQIKCNLTTDYLLDLFEKQNGLCAITGLPMACYQHPCFSVSADRINNNLGHMIGNVQLVLKCINRAKSTFSNDDVKQWLSQIKESYHARIN